MSVQPFFSLSPINSEINNYDPANTEAPYVFATLSSYGGWTNGFTGNAPALANLGIQCERDEIILGYNSVSPNDQSIDDVVNDVFRRCCIRILVKFENLSADNQVLFVMALRNPISTHPLAVTPHAQFFVNHSFVNTEVLATVSYERVSILMMDAPTNGVFTDITIRLAAERGTPLSALGFGGVDCYLL